MPVTTRPCEPRTYALARCEEALTLELFLQIVRQQLGKDATARTVVCVMAMLFDLAEEGEDPCHPW